MVGEASRGMESRRRNPSLSAGFSQLQVHAGALCGSPRSSREPESAQEYAEDDSPPPEDFEGEGSVRVFGARGFRGSGFRQSPASPFQQEELSLGGIIQDPFVPTVLDGIEEETPRPVPYGGGERLPPPGRGGVERYPSVPREPNLYPGVSLVLGDGQVISELAPFTTQEPVDLTGQDALSSKKNGHG